MPHLSAARLTIGALVALATLAPSAQAQPAYEVPPDNPFVAVPGARGEVYAYGLRNPFRWSFDRLTGDMYVGDVGGTVLEEITFVPRAQSAGANFGWPCWEGDASGPQACVPQNYKAPQHTYSPTSQPVVGGYVARHPSLGSYVGRYLFGRFGGPQLYVMNAGGGPEQAHDGREEGRLAGAVAAEQGDRLALADGQVDAVQDGAAAVAGAQPLHLQQGGHLVPSKNRSSRAASPR